jgi:hypothetical protein
MPGLGKGMLEGADDHAAHQTGIPEPDLALGRVDIDIDRAGRRLDIQRQHGMAVVSQDVAIGAAHGAGEQLVAHRPLIDE